MNNTAPVGLGVIAVAGMIGLVGGTMTLVMYDAEIMAAFGYGGGIAVVAMIALWFGWRPPQGGPSGPRDLSSGASAGRIGAKGSPSKKAAASNGTTAQAHDQVRSAAQAAAPAPVAEGAESAIIGQRPDALSAARDGQADDLKLIKGVGPKLEMLCNSMGFYHFAQIAHWSAEEISWVDENLEGFKGRVTRDEWVAQARALMIAGDVTED
ncbi:MAG: putative flap endonuclease-1-like 5' DNA nuclease [Paracoccaceae bacterium]|jgi:predicted flap endonuclease-1-like 5' DNA nuclease